MKYGDNRDIKVKVEEKEKYHERIASTVSFFYKMNKPPLKVVDIGARDGYATQLLTELGYDVIGTELIQGFVDHAQKRNRNVIFDDIMNTKLPEHSFDAIFSRHCIEHCKDTLTFLNNCAKLLKKDGTALITFPLENEIQFKGRKHPGKNHMAYFPNKNAFRSIVKMSELKEALFCKSASVGIIPDKKEVTFIGIYNG